MGTNTLSCLLTMKMFCLFDPFLHFFGQHLALSSPLLNVLSSAHCPAKPSKVQIYYMLHNAMHIAHCIMQYCSLDIAILLTGYCSIVLIHTAYCMHCKISTAFFVSVVTKHIWGVMANLLFDGYEVLLWRNRGN